MNEDNYWEDQFEKHKDWRKQYRKDESMQGHLPEASPIVDILSSTEVQDTESPLHPDNIAEREEEEEANMDTLNSYLHDWFTTEYRLILNATSGQLYDIVDKSLLETHINEVKVAANMQPYKDEYTDAILNLFGNKQTMQVLEFRDKVLDWLSAPNEGTAEFDKLLEIYKEDSNEFQLPNGLGNWIAKGIKPSGLRGYIDSYDSWFKSSIEVGALVSLDLEPEWADSYYILDTQLVQKKLSSKTISAADFVSTWREVLEVACTKENWRCITCKARH